MGRRSKRGGRRGVTLEEKERQREDQARLRLATLSSLRSAFPGVEDAVLLDVADQCGLDLERAVLSLSSMLAPPEAPAKKEEEVPAEEVRGSAAIEAGSLEALLAEMFGVPPEDAAAALAEADGDLDEVVEALECERHVRDLCGVVDSWRLPDEDDEEEEDDDDDDNDADDDEVPEEPSPAVWSCALCTFENTDAVLACAMCGELPPGLLEPDAGTGAAPAAAKPTLQEVMDAEMAQQLDARMQLERRAELARPWTTPHAAGVVPFDSVWHHRDAAERAVAPDFGSRLKLEALQKRLPFVDRSVLLSTYTNCGHDYAATLAAFGVGDRPGSAPAGPLFGLRSNRPAARVRGHEIVRLDGAGAAGAGRGRGKGSAAFGPDAGLADDDALYSEARADAAEAARRRGEFFRRAARAYQGGNRAYAGQLAARARDEAQRAADAQLDAVRRIFTAKNRGSGAAEVDLHGLHVGEALCVLGALLDRLRGRRRPLRIITGVGRGSAGGRARILPAVLEFLKRRGLRASRPAPGVLKVRT